MRINSNVPGHIAKIYQSYQSQQTEAAPTGKNQEAKGLESDSVKLSESARKISELIKETKDLPEVREEKIARIQAEIKNNTYHVSAQQLAAKMLASDHE